MPSLLEEHPRGRVIPGHSGLAVPQQKGRAGSTPQSYHPGQRGRGAGSGALTPGWGRIQGSI